METLKPVEVSEFYITQIAAGMKRYFNDEIFSKIFAILDDKTSIYNAKSELLEAIRTGRVYYQYGAFRTDSTFSSKIVKELRAIDGIEYRNYAYFIDRSKIPAQIESALALRAAVETAKLTAIDVLLIRLYGEIGKRSLESFIGKATEKAFKKLEFDILKSAEEKKIPVIEYKIAKTKAKLPQSQVDDVNKYWSDKEKQIKDKQDKIKGLKDKLKDLKDKNKNKDKGKNKDKDNIPPKSDVPDINVDSPTDTPPLVDDVPETPKEDKDSDTSSTTDDGKTEEELKEEISKEQQELKDLQTSKYAEAPKVDFEDLNIDWQSRKIAKDYVHNMEYWVKGWEAKNIIKMREEVLDMISKGVRVPQIKKYFQDRWQIAENKAEFLARNESGLASSVIKATRYQSMGFTHFQWDRSSSKCKRKLHEEYYGKVFAFDNPPVIDEKLNIKGLPRQIWNCKCHLRPVFNNSFFANRRKINNAKRNIFKKIQYAIENSTQRNNNPWRYRRFGEGT